MIYLILCSFLLIFLYCSILFFVWMKLKKNDIADIWWGLWFCVLIIFLFFFNDISNREIILLIMVLIWWIRLSIHILIKNKNKSEDFRYKQMRDDFWKNFVIKSFFYVYFLQWILLLIISSPLIIGFYFLQTGLTYFDVFWVLIFLIWFLIETLADYQLKKFKDDSNNKWKIMSLWLWKYSRHPNYFWEILVWWWIFLVCLNSPFWIYWIVWPICITYFLIFVSWIPLLEKKYKWNIEFEKYKNKTSVLIPWFNIKQ